MDKVIEIDEANMAVTVQCGITLGELAAEGNKKGWDILTASSIVYADTVGGQLSGYVESFLVKSGHWAKRPPWVCSPTLILLFPEETFCKAIRGAANTSLTSWEKGASYLISLIRPNSQS